MAHADKMPERLEQVQRAFSAYAIEREVGSGGMATVYLAHDKKHDRRVAIKILHAELAAVLGAERFLQEIRVTANLQRGPSRTSSAMIAHRATSHTFMASVRRDAECEHAVLRVAANDGRCKASWGSRDSTAWTSTRTHCSVSRCFL